jgi:hypothetical protein
MSSLSGQVAFEIDDATRTATVVYFGQLTEQQVLDFYSSEALPPHVIETYDFLVDQRHTKYQPAEGAIHRLAAALRQRVGAPRLDLSRRRIALVRRDQPDSFAMTHGAPMRVEFGSDFVRYFDDIEAARAWLRQGHAEADRSV